MKKLLLLILVSCFCFGLKAQADSGQPFSVFSNGDESYEISHCVIECEDGESPVFYFQKMFDLLGTESNPVERVYVKFNAL